MIGTKIAKRPTTFKVGRFRSAGPGRKQGLQTCALPRRGDLWLNRASQISQFVLAVVTVGTLYFTVLPLYQKAVLEESLARKEVELKQANQSIEKAYARLRTMAMKDFTFYAKTKCTGLLDPPPTSTEKKSRADSWPVRLLTADVGACIVEISEKHPSLDDLRQDEREILAGKIVEVSREVREEQKAAQALYDDVPLQPIVALRDAAGKDDSSGSSMLEMLSKFEPRGITEADRRRADIRHAQTMICANLSQKIGDKISGLMKIDWPAAN